MNLYANFEEMMPSCSFDIVSQDCSGDMDLLGALLNTRLLTHERTGLVTESGLNFNGKHKALTLVSLRGLVRKPTEDIPSPGILTSK